AMALEQPYEERGDEQQDGQPERRPQHLAWEQGVQGGPPAGLRAGRDRQRDVHERARQVHPAFPVGRDEEWPRGDVDASALDLLQQRLEIVLLDPAREALAPGHLAPPPPLWPFSASDWSSSSWIRYARPSRRATSRHSSIARPDQPPSASRITNGGAENVPTTSSREAWAPAGRFSPPAARA